MSDTPRTDSGLEATWKSVNVLNNPIPADFARQLERELVVARTPVPRKARVPRYDCDMVERISNGPHDDLYVTDDDACELEDKIDQLERELAEVTKQRDELAQSLRPILKWMGVDASLRTKPESYASDMAKKALRALAAVKGGAK